MARRFWPDQYGTSHHITVHDVACAFLALQYPTHATHPHTHTAHRTAENSRSGLEAPRLLFLFALGVAQGARGTENRERGAVWPLSLFPGASRLPWISECGPSRPLVYSLPALLFPAYIYMCAYTRGCLRVYIYWCVCILSCYTLFSCLFLVFRICFYNKDPTSVKTKSILLIYNN